MKYALIIGTAFAFIGTLGNGIIAWRKGERKVSQWFFMAIVSFLLCLLVIFVEPK